MSADDVLIFGAGRLGRQIVHHVRNYSSYSVLGFIDDTLPAGTPVLAGVNCVGGLEEVRAVAQFSVDRVSVVFAIGYADMHARAAALGRVSAAGYRLADVMHPRAMIEPGAQISAGCIILAGAVIDQNVAIGAGCFVDISVRIGEDSTVGSNNYFSSGAAIGGSVQVGDNNFFGMDCTATTGVRIGSNCFINAKTLVARHLRDNIKLVELHKSKELPN